MAFTILQQALMYAPVLTAPDPTLLFLLNTDASNGAVLSEKGPEGKRVVVYFSRIFKKSAQRYYMTWQELLAVVVAAQHFKYYLCAVLFTIRTPHAALQWLMSFREPKGQVVGWLEELKSFQFSIEYRHARLCQVCFWATKDCGVNSMCCSFLMVCCSAHERSQPRWKRGGRLWFPNLSEKLCWGPAMEVQALVILAQKLCAGWGGGFIWVSTDGILKTSADAVKAAQHTRGHLTSPMLLYNSRHRGTDGEGRCGHIGPVPRVRQGKQICAMCNGLFYKEARGLCFTRPKGQKAKTVADTLIEGMFSRFGAPERHPQRPRLKLWIQTF